VRRRRRRRRNPPPTVIRSGEPRLRPLAAIVALPRRSPLHPQLARGLAAADRWHLLRSDLAPVPVRATATTRQSGCYRWREGDPVDLRVSRLHGRVALSFLHELGHFVDHQLGSGLGQSWASGAHEAFEPWRAAAAALPSRAAPASGRSHRRYFDSAREVWARSYAQTVLARSSDPVLEAELATLQAAEDAFVWSTVELDPVADAIEDVLARLGLLRRALAVAV
jgi:hypothetical protein